MAVWKRECVIQLPLADLNRKSTRCFARGLVFTTTNTERWVHPTSKRARVQINSSVVWYFERLENAKKNRAIQQECGHCFVAEVLRDFALTLPCSTTEACFVVLATLTAIFKEYTRSSVGTNST